MRIARVQVNNYRNLKSADIKLGALVTLVGENNSGKSNFLRAMTLPFMADEGSVGKRLSWFDINSDVKDHYYSFIQEHSNEIADGSMGLESFRAVIPSVTVTVDLQYDRLMPTTPKTYWLPTATTLFLAFDIDGSWRTPSRCSNL